MEDRRLDVCLEEYRALRSEIELRIHHQLLILGGSVALIVAAIPVLPGAIAEHQAGVLLLGAVAFVLLGWLYVEQDVLLVTAAAYINHELRAEIVKALREGGPGSRDAPQDTEIAVLGWEDFKGSDRWAMAPHRVTRFRFIFRSAATIGPAILLVLGAIALRIDSGIGKGWVGVGEFVLLLIAVLGAGVLARLQTALYQKGRRALATAGDR